MDASRRSGGMHPFIFRVGESNAIHPNFFSAVHSSAVHSMNDHHRRGLVASVALGVALLVAVT